MTISKGVVSLLATSIVLLGGCASGEYTGDSPWEVPDYVQRSPSGWTVNCLGSFVSTPTDRGNPFYRPDGTEKSRTEYCAEISTATHIRRR